MTALRIGDELKTFPIRKSIEVLQSFISCSIEKIIFSQTDQFLMARDFPPTRVELQIAPNPFKHKICTQTLNTGKICSKKGDNVMLILRHLIF